MVTRIDRAGSGFREKAEVDISLNVCYDADMREPPRKRGALPYEDRTR